MKAAHYLDIGLEQLVPDGMWISQECDYDVAASLGISHWWLKKQQFYVDRFQAQSDRKSVRSPLQIISVVKIQIHPIHGYDYLKSIVLRRADFKEYTISEGDFKHLRPNDFEDLYLLHLQGKLHHLPSREKKTLVFAVLHWIRGIVIRKRVENFQLGIESYQSQLNLTRPQWDIASMEPVADFTVIESPMAVMFRDRYNVPKVLRFKELHKFSDGTLQMVDEALDFRVKEYQVYSHRSGRYTNH